MTRYKGRQSAKAVERDFPHVVEITVPPNGLGERLDDMYDFHAQRGIQPKRGPVSYTHLTLPTILLV